MQANKSRKMIKISQLKINVNHSEAELENKISKLLKRPVNSFTYKILKRSIDARKKRGFTEYFLFVFEQITFPDLSKNPYWYGNITKLRIDPTTGGVGHYYIDRVAFMDYPCYTIKISNLSRRKRLPMNCKFCNAELEAGTAVCPQCGKELTEESVQHNCPCCDT